MINNPLENWSPETLDTGVRVAATEQGQAGCGSEELCQGYRGAAGYCQGEGSLRKDKNGALIMCFRVDTKISGL